MTSDFYKSSLLILVLDNNVRPWLFNSTIITSSFWNSKHLELDDNQESIQIVLLLKKCCSLTIITSIHFHRGTPFLCYSFPWPCHRNKNIEKDWMLSIWLIQWWRVSSPSKQYCTSSALLIINLETFKYISEKSATLQNKTSGSKMIEKFCFCVNIFGGKLSNVFVRI